MASPDPTAQHYPLVLTVTPAIDGYRLAFVAGPIFEPVATFPTAEEAYAAFGAAKSAVDFARPNHTRTPQS